MSSGDETLGVASPVPRNRWLLPSPSLGYAGKVALTAVAYFGFTELGKALLLTGPAGAFWPSAGLGIAILYLGGLRWWPAVLLGDLGSLLMDVSSLGVPAGTALGEAAGDLARTVVSVVVLQRLAGPRIAMDRLSHVGAVLVSVVSGALISATVAMVAVVAGDLVRPSEMGVFWRSWWLGDVSGGLVVLPLALAWAQPVARLVRERAVPEGAIVLAAVGALSFGVISSSEPLTYVVFPALIWAALRLDVQGATLAIVLAVFIAVGITSNELGAFVEHSSNDSALDLQLYITIASLTTLCLAAVVSERRRTKAALMESRARVVAAADAERRRIERDLHDGAQQQLVALRVKLGVAEELLDGDPALARAKVGEMGVLIDDALTRIRSLAAGVYPSVLVASGLGDALRELTRQSSVPATLEADGSARCPPEMEEAVYFCCSEALQNANKHAQGATHITIRLEQSERGLRFEVRDDGGGFSPQEVRRTGGLANMRVRIEAVNGKLTIASSPGDGTIVRGSIGCG